MIDPGSKTATAGKGALKTSTKWLLILALVVLGKLSGLLKDILLTFYHGVSDVTDAYFLSSSISSLVYMAVYAAVPVIVVPLYSRLKEALSNVAITAKLSSAYVFFIAITLLLTVCVYVSAPYLIEKLAGDVNDTTSASAITYLRIMALTFSLSTIVAFLNAVQTVDKVVIPSYVVPVVNNSLFCFGLLFFSGSEEFGKVLYLGVIAWLVLALANHHILRKSVTLYPRWFRGSLRDEKFLMLLLPAVMAFYIEYANNFVGVYFAAGLKPGSISVLAYANKLNLILVSVFLVVLTTSIFPKIAAALARGDSTEVSDYLVRVMRSVAIFGVPIIVFAIFCSEEIVRLLFERGNFSKNDVLAVAAVFSIVLVALPFSLLRDIMNRVYFSYNNTVVPAVVTLGSFSVNVMLSYFLHDEFGLNGLAIAMVGSTVLNSVVMGLLVRQKVGGAVGGAAIKVIIPCLLAISCASALLVWSYGRYDAYWILLFIPFSVVYFTVLYILRVDEISTLASVGLKWFSKR